LATPHIAVCQRWPAGELDEEAKPTLRELDEEAKPTLRELDEEAKPTLRELSLTC